MKAKEPCASREENAAASRHFVPKCLPAQARTAQPFVILVYNSHVIPKLSRSSIVALIVACAVMLAATGVAIRAPNRDARWHRVRWVASGGIGAMLLALPIVGPGTIAPLAALIGAMLLAAGALFGGLLGGLAAIRDRRRP